MLGESALIGRVHATELDAGMNDILSKEPTPENATCFADAFDHLIDKPAGFDVASNRDSQTEQPYFRGNQRRSGHVEENRRSQAGVDSRTSGRRPPDEAAHCYAPRRRWAGVATPASLRSPGRTWRGRSELARSSCRTCRSPGPATRPGRPGPFWNEKRCSAPRFR